MEDAINPVKVFVLPGWIHRSIIRNNLNIVDVSDYAKMRNILSLEDFSEWVYMNDILKIDNQAYISTNTLDQLFNSDTLSKQQLMEYRNSVLPLSGAENIAETISSKLSAYNSMNDKPYSFISVGNNNLIIINEGFFNVVNDANQKLEFIKQYLKLCYSLYSVKRVSLTSIFNLYVKLV